jgi:hypothetical protein
VAEHLVTRTITDGAEISTSAWINDKGELISAVNTHIYTGQASASITLWPTVDETRALIANLEQHLHNIKTLELELLASQTKAAA